MRAPSALATALLLFGAFATGASAHGRSLPLPGATLTDGRISDEVTLTRWAHPTRPALVHAHPRGRSRVIGRLRTHTEDGFPEVTPALVRLSVPGGVWIKVRVAGRPNGRVGWVPRAVLGAFHVVTTRLVVDRVAARATLYRRGRAVWRTRVGTGKPSTPTPTGRFWIREAFRVVPADPLYGPYAFGTSDYSVLSDWPGGGVIGIHGTDEPELIPGRPSHGCIRMRNAAISWLGRDGHLPIGTPLLVR